ncbi:drug/metabolite transporter (DMT)-like permease [Kitasatospora sp. MAP12-15]|uniref:EamA family transporter n=1 Tax=unclassified Kitasatospora TaxID=2633591 RepID=UPI002473C256|nr:EamA family transporter [Kitasatospora sp. MAP12-44]MDH6115043.1 drug/metabolite transporter (DMT)-like permease [Kitasatospora sp. MAP12-44]
MTTTGPHNSSESTAAPDGTVALERGRLSGTVWAALAVVYVVWGSTYLAIRIVVESMPPLLSGAIRFLTAGLLLLGLTAWRQGTGALRVTWRQLASAALVGVLLLVGGNGLVVLAEGRIPSGMAALLIAVVPLWVVLLRMASGERPRAGALLGVLLGLVGLAVLSAPGITGKVSLVGVLMLMGSSIAWSIGSFGSSRLPMPANPLTASAYEMLVGGSGCLLVSLARGEEHGLDLAAISTRSWVALAYLVVFGSLLAFTAYAWLLQSAPLGLVATYAYVNPVVAVFLGWLVLAEQLTLPEVLGGAIVVVAVGVVVSTSRRS